MIRLNWKRVRELRDQRGLQIKQVAEATKIDKRTLSDWETGDVKDVWVGRLYTLATFYGVSLMDLLMLPEVETMPPTATQAQIRAQAKA